MYSAERETMEEPPSDGTGEEFAAAFVMRSIGCEEKEP